jgi:2'-5' RNA ligase
MRLFIAVNFDDGVKSRLLAVQSQIKTQSFKGNFSRPENLHLTLIFIGETPEDRVPAIGSIIAALRRPPFTLDFTRTGCFTHRGKELWWIGADRACPGLRALEELRRRVTAGLVQAGVDFDDRPFNAHITLGREIKHAAPIQVSAGRITVPVNRISLMQSAHIRGALVYTEIAGQDLRQG